MCTVALQCFFFFFVFFFAAVVFLSGVATVGGVLSSWRLLCEGEMCG